MINLKELAPECTKHPWAGVDIQCEHGKWVITMWEGKGEDYCEGVTEIHIGQKSPRQKKFELPRIPYQFMLVSGKIYYRKLAE